MENQNSAIEFERVIDLLDTTAAIWNDEIERTDRVLRSLFCDAGKLFESDRIENSETSYQFNTFSLFHIDEPKHSEILASILDPQGTHGQGDRFLKLYLEELGFSGIELDGVWTVNAETAGRVDILIRREIPNHAAVIIENKSYNAQDQESQLYRYWEQIVFRRCGRCDKLPETYRIVYLSPTKEKSASGFTKKRPDYLRDPNLPEVLPEEWITHQQFGADIVPWLNECIDSLAGKNTRYREFLKQYVELLKKLK